MKTAHLHDIWTSPDNSRLTSKQFSFRFPVHIAAKIAALCDLYPTKNRTQIVADLLTAALDDLESNLPEAKGERLDERSLERILAKELGAAQEDYYFVEGQRGRFRELANDHFLELEKELGNSQPEQLYPDLYAPESSFNKY